MTEQLRKRRRSTRAVSANDVTSRVPALLTPRFDEIERIADATVLDVGAGSGRHTYELFRRGANVVSLDGRLDELAAIRHRLRAMAVLGVGDLRATGGGVLGDACVLPFETHRFDIVIATEVLEHIVDDGRAVHEIARVLRPGGRVVVSVPAWLPERVNWALSDDYHAPARAGGHVRIYRRAELVQLLEQAGLAVDRQHRAHALHTPYWWLRCAVGPSRDDQPVVSWYRRLLDVGIAEEPRWWRATERVFAPIIGKSLVVYATKRDRRG